MPRTGHDHDDEQSPAATGAAVFGEDLVRTRVSEVQRARMLAAMAQVASERGASNVTVAHVVARSGVSRRTFYELFGDRDECFLAAFDAAVERIAAVVVPAWRDGGSWRERIRGSLIELLSFLDDDPVTGRLVVVESLGAGRLILERRGRVLAQMIAFVDEGRDEAKGGSGPAPLVAEGVAGAVFSVIHARMLAGDRRPLLELAGPLMSTIVLPYLGPAAARRELERPVPKASSNSRRTSSDPLRELDMRLTDRTMRVLIAAAGSPGSSNRAVADGAGITDQGQISKLLHRLERLGLVENIGGGARRGEPNAWRLTARGVAVERAIRESAHGAGGAQADGRAVDSSSSSSAGRGR